MSGTVSGAAGTPPRAGPPPGPSGGENGAPALQYGDSGAQSGCRLSRASRGPGFSCCRTRPARVTATGCLCYFHRGRGKGRLHTAYIPSGCGQAAVRCRSARRGRCAPTQARRMGRLKDEIPLSTSIYAQKYTPWAYIFEPLLDLLPRRGRQPGARGRAARPPARPHSNPLHPPHSLKQITGCATES